MHKHDDMDSGNYSCRPNKATGAPRCRARTRPRRACGLAATRRSALGLPDLALLQLELLPNGCVCQYKAGSGVCTCCLCHLKPGCSPFVRYDAYDRSFFNGDEPVIFCEFRDSQPLH